jgi:DNA-binding beta-propeller fold protein YncE
MAVIDGKSRMVMRYFGMGADSSQIENAHEVEFTSDGRYAFVCFYSGNYVQKMDVNTDQVISGVNMGSVTPVGGGWSILDVSPNDSQLAVTNYIANSFGIIQDAAMTISSSDYFAAGSLMAYAHGICHTPGFDTFFLSLQFGNTILKCAPHAKPHAFFKQISVNGLPHMVSQPLDSTSPNPHQVQMLPDYDRYFVACQGTNELRVMDAHTDTLITVIPVGRLPQEMTLSVSKGYLLVTCMQDQNANTQPGRLGSVYVVDYNTYQVVKVLNGDFYQPHDLCVDEQDGLIYIASTNGDPNGIPIHHPIPGGGRPGWYTVYDLNTLQPADNRRYEVLVFPYAMNARF